MKLLNTSAPKGTYHRIRFCHSIKKSAPPTVYPQFFYGLPSRLNALCPFIRVRRIFFAEAKQSFFKEVTSMRKMRCIKSGQVIDVAEHIITKNLWEFYVFDYFLGSSNANALVMGSETEAGLINFDEIKPFIISRTKKLNDVAPATGWEWI